MDDIQGALSMGQPAGVLDPRWLALLQAGLTGMQASGPSKTPTSLGQIIGQAGQAGLGAYSQGITQQRQLDQLAQQKLLQQAQIKKAQADAAKDEQATAEARAQQDYLALPETQAALQRGDHAGVLSKMPKLTGANVTALAGIQSTAAQRQADTQQRADAARESLQARIADAQQRSADRQASMEDRAAAREEANQLRRDMMNESMRGRQDNIRLAASLRPERQEAAPVAVVRKDGQGIELVSRADAIGRIPASMDADTQGALATARGKAKLNANLPQAKLRTESMLQNLNRLDDAMVELNDDPGLSNITGTIAGRTWNLTNTATGAQAKLNSIKSQIFQSSLQAMREASKTGGAVGNVSDKEGDKLERTLAALDQAQGTGDFKAQMKKAIEQVRLSKALIQNAFDEQFGDASTQPSVPSASPTRSFNSVAEAEKAMLPKGTKITIGGRSATVQ